VSAPEGASCATCRYGTQYDYSYIVGYDELKFGGRWPRTASGRFHAAIWAKDTLVRCNRFPTPVSELGLTHWCGEFSA
jgi:hypothetical protein